MWRFLKNLNKSSKIQNDDEAVADILAGGEEGLRFIYYRYGQPLLHFFQKRFRFSQEEAEEVFQETLLKFLSNISNYDKTRGCLLNYLATIGINLAIDSFKQNSKLVSDNSELLLEIADPTNLEHKLCYQLCVTRALHHCEQHIENKEKIKECLTVLTFKGEGQYTIEIAKNIGRTNAATREFISQCRKKLKPFLFPCIKDCGEL